MSKKLIVVADTKVAIFYKALGLKIKEQKSQIKAEDIGIEHNPPSKREGFFHIGSSPSHFFDPHSEAKNINREEFAKKVVDQINSLYNQERFDELIMVAEPKTLGELRSNLPHNLKSIVSKEVPKELVYVDKEEIEVQVFGK